MEEKRMYFMRMFHIAKDFFITFEKIVACILGLVHVGQLFFFACIEIPQLVIANIISILFYIVMIRMCKNSRNMLKIFVAITMEVSIYSITAVFFLGPGGRFELYPLALLIFAFITQYALAIRNIEGIEKRRILILMPSILFNLGISIILAVIGTFHNPIYEMRWDSFRALVLVHTNMFIIISCVIIGCGMFFAYATGYAQSVNKNMNELEKMKELAEEASKAKGTFLATMTHEIRTPMNAICGTADLLSDEELSETASDYVNTIQVASRHLLSLINNVLDFSKIESGNIEILEQDYRVNELFHEVIEIMTVRANAKHISIVSEIDNNIPRILYGDSGRIRQIIINFMNNAVKFTDEGSITIKAFFEKIEETSNEGFLNLEIIDTGRGIKQEDMDKLFGAFVQVDKENNRGIEGPGLGLAISKNLVEKMDGAINVTSEYGKGSNFSFKVKQKVVDESPCNYKYTKLSDNKKEDIKSKIMIQNAKVLIVDDNRINLKVASGLLKRLGVETILAESGKEAINLLKNGEKYDIVFMDYYMPEMDGIETTKIIRTIDDYCKNELIVVALTANAVEDAKEEFFEAGINDYLIKPIVPLRLNEILTKWLPNEKVIVE